MKENRPRPEPPASTWKTSQDWALEAKWHEQMAESCAARGEVHRAAYHRSCANRAEYAAQLQQGCEARMASDHRAHVTYFVVVGALGLIALGLTIFGWWRP